MNNEEENKKQEENLNSKIITLYHGTDHLFEKPEYGKGKPYNDYGLGFYCTKIKELACEWSVDENRDGIINQYCLNIENAEILNLNNQEYPVLKWLNILLKNRTFNCYSQLRAEGKKFLNKNFNIDYENADIIVGYRADDSYFQFAKDFLDGNIPYRTLVNAMYYGNLGNQYVLKSKKAFELIKYIQSETTEAGIYYQKKVLRETEARNNYKLSKTSKLQQDDIFILDIIRGNLTDEQQKILQQRISTGSPERTRSDD